MLAENIANIDTPGYKTKQLDAKAFQKALGVAMKRRDGDHQAPFKLESTRQVRQKRDGSVEFNPSTHPTENILFHDDTNASLERQMALLAENGMTYQLATQLLGGRYDGMLKAIRGRVA